MKTPVFSKEERDYLNLIDKNFNSNDKYFCCSAYKGVTSQMSFKIGRYPFESKYILDVLADFIVKDEAEKSREKGMKTPVLSKEEQDYLNIIDKNFNVNDKYFCYSPYRDVMSYTSFKIECYPFEDEDVLNVLADFVVKDEAEKSREKAMQKLKKMNSDELISIFNETCPYCDRYIGDMEDFDEWLETCIDADLDVSPERLAFLMKYVDEMIK